MIDQLNNDDKYMKLAICSPSRCTPVYCVLCHKSSGGSGPRRRATGQAEITSASSSSGPTRGREPRMWLRDSAAGVRNLADFGLAEVSDKQLWNMASDLRTATPPGGGLHGPP